jgi:hypothetical protein
MVMGWGLLDTIGFFNSGENIKSWQTRQGSLRQWVVENFL